MKRCLVLHVGEEWAGFTRPVPAPFPKEEHELIDT